VLVFFDFGFGCDSDVGFGFGFDSGSGSNLMTVALPDHLTVRLCCQLIREQNRSTLWPSCKRHDREVHRHAMLG